MDVPPSLEEFQRQWALEETIIDREQQLLEEMEARNDRQLKMKYIYRNHATAHNHLMADYFDESCTYTDLQFRRRYSMKRPLFLQIVDSISNYDEYFTQRRNNAGKLDLSSIQKCTAVIRMLAYGVSADACDEYAKIGESTAIECTRNFYKDVIALFQDEYLRQPSVEDLQRLLQVGDERGFRE